MPIFAKVLKAKNSLNFQGKNTKIDFNPHQKIMTVETQKGETLVARSLGKGQWEYLSGGLSEGTFNHLKTTIAPQVEKQLHRIQENRKKQKILASLT